MKEALVEKLRREVKIHIAMVGEDELSNDILTVLADRTRYEKRIGELEDGLREILPSDSELFNSAPSYRPYIMDMTLGEWRKARALLGEGP